MSVFFDCLQLNLPKTTSILELKKIIVKFNSQCVLNVEDLDQISAPIEQWHSVYSAIIFVRENATVGCLILEILFY